MAKRPTTSNGITHEDIAAVAYSIFEKSGRIQGRDIENWLQAEAQLLQERRQPAQIIPTQRHETKQVTRAVLVH